MKPVWKKIILCSVAAAVLGGVAAFLFLVQIPRPFYISACGEYIPRFVRVVAALDEEYVRRGYLPSRRSLQDGEELGYNEHYKLHLIVDSFFPQQGHVSWRTLYRDDERIRVVYVSVTQTAATSIHQMLVNRQTQNRLVRNTAFQYIEYPKIVEIYYLPRLHRIIGRIDRLSDEEFDALRADATHVWSGAQPQEIAEPEPAETEDEPTHAVLERLHRGFILEYPVDWRYSDTGHLHIFPQGRPYLATWYDRTVFEMIFSPLNSERHGTIDPEEWLEFHTNSDFAEPITIDGVQAFLLWDSTVNQTNRTMHPYARTARYVFIHRDRLFQIELRSGDGCLDEWAVMLAILDSVRLL